ncbi:vacuolar protein-sorting-associated protein 36-like [Argopecten irradians]|uniref:vacuolar protein-sorting-associated protein 36-like n=1 Tax=Argopecten irradians TaxID=31199 RepID=UPI0037188BAD
MTSRPFQLPVGRKMVTIFTNHTINRVSNLFYPKVQERPPQPQMYPVEQHNTFSYQPPRPQQSIAIYHQSPDVYESASPPPGFVSQQNTKYSIQLQEPLNSITLIDKTPRYQNRPSHPPGYAGPLPVSLPRVTFVTSSYAGYNDYNDGVQMQEREKRKELRELNKKVDMMTKQLEKINFEHKRLKAAQYSDNYEQYQRHCRGRQSPSDYDDDDDYYGHSPRLQTSRRHHIRSAEKINDEKDHHRRHRAIQTARHNHKGHSRNWNDTHQKLLKKREVMEVKERKGCKRKSYVWEKTFHV